MQNPMQKFRQSSIVFGKPGTLSEKFKTLTCFNCRAVEYSLFQILLTFPTYQCLQKGAWDFLKDFVQILICLQKLKLKKPDFYTHKSGILHFH